MKALFAIGMLMILCGDLHAQSSAADSVKAYIKSEGYVPITHKSKMPKAMKPYYSIILDSIKHANPEMAQWYIRLDSFKIKRKLSGSACIHCRQSNF